MTTDLAAFQSSFARALLGRNEPSPLAGRPAFAVYRNTVMKGWVDALEANYPAVVRLVGPQWFRTVATDYAIASAADDARLVTYGRTFPEFLAAYQAAGELPYLPGVAHLDRCWSEAHVASEADTDSKFLAAVPVHELGAVRLAAHPAARWRWFDELPVFSIWSRNRSDAAPGGELDWRGEGALLTRPHDTVQWRSASRPECAFLDACAGGTRLAEAAAAALASDASVDLAGLLAGLLRAGALVFPTPPNCGAST